MPAITSEKKIRTFALVLSGHRLWGTLLLPYMIYKEPGKSYFRLSECLFPFPDDHILSILEPEEREIVTIINQYSERNLFKLFSKDKTVKDFLANASPEMIENFIRPYIERRLYKCFLIARDENTPVYFQKTRSTGLHLEDQLDISQVNAQPVFRFMRDSEQSTYNLSLETAGRLIDMRNRSIDILCMSPCLIREEKRILFVSDVDGSKLRPFLTRDFIQIPRKAELKYFSSFVLNAVNHYKVEGSGFEIIEFIPEKKVILQAEININNTPVVTLIYEYQGSRLYASEMEMTFSIFEHNNDKFIFRRYHRDIEWEKACRTKLEELGFFSDDDVSFLPVSPEKTGDNYLYALVEAINSSYDELTSAGFVLTSKLNLNFNLKPVSIELNSTLVNDWFDLKASVKIGEWEFPFTRFRKNILSGIREFELPDGTVAVLPETWFSKYKNIFEFGKSVKDKLKLHKQHFSLLAESLSKEESPVFQKLEKLLIPEHLPVITLPAGLKCNMRDYQAEGLNWLGFLQAAGLGGCLADDMGLGKTVQTLALLQHNKETFNTGTLPDGSTDLTLFGNDEPVLTSLIIVPASLIYNWENEIRRFVPGMRMYSHKGTQRRKTTSWFKNFDIILSSYHTVRQDIDLLCSINFHYVILDESQMIKNPGSAVHRTMIKLRSEHKLVLTGTPVENSLTDLWSQLSFVNPGLLGDLSFFRREFARPIEKGGDNEQESKLRKIIKPFILRRTKEMVAADLPPVTEQTVFCDMTEEQMKLYDEEKSFVRNSILKSIETEGLEKSAILVLQGLMKLRQISNHPVMAYDDYSSGSGKFETVLQDMESVISEGHKILVFSSFVKHLTLYADELARKKISYSMLTGASTNRDKIVNSFQDDPSNRIFLISLKAGGVGLNLTAADYVFILDPWWNPASEVQAMNRAHRIGQDKSVFMYKYITSNTIEEKITRLQERKSHLADMFITTNNPVKDIDLNQILDIIG